MSRPFNLEHAVAAWRRFLPESRALSAEEADELESHLHDEIDDLIRDGYAPAEAFEAAMRRLGDGPMLEEVYRAVYWKRVMGERRLKDEINWSASMLKNYLTTAFRNVRRQKGYAFINVAGLSIGLACSFFILLWVMHELSINRYHEDGDRIYRVWRNVSINGEIHTWGDITGLMGEALTKDYPEIENATYTGFGTRFLVTYEGQSFREQGNYASRDFFDVFTFPLLEGDPARALQAENSVVISERLAAKLFGKEWRKSRVVGKTINLNHEEDFTITAVAENVPDHSTLQFDVLVPMQAFFARNPGAQTWGSNWLPLYARLREGASLAEVNRKIADVEERYHPEGQKEVIFLQPFEEMHLYGEFENGISTGGRIELVRIFSLVAFFLLVIASINFMNLATARSTLRSREIGVRKAIGATQRSLAGQFMAESIVLAAFAFVLAMGMVLGLLPVFNLISGKHIGVTDLSPAYLTGVFGIALVTGLLAGSYPALYLSSFNPVAILRGTFRQKPGEARLRKGLVVFQFALSTLIIVSTAAVYFQIRYIMEKELGVERENVVSFGLEGQVREQYETFRQELLKQPGIVNVTTSTGSPLSIYSSTSSPTWDGKDPNDETEFSVLTVNYDFVETMRMELAAGRTHARPFGADSAGYLINEQLARLMGKANPVGERFAMWGREGHVLGVLKDFHMASFDSPIMPTVFRLEPRRTWQVWVRTEEGKTREALAGLAAVYKEFNPEYPFEYEFLDRQYEEQYRSVLAMGTLANIFAVIAVLISCLGLFGLASFTAARRTKEIGIRKVLGASASHLVVLLSADFTKLVLLGFVLAAPLAYFAAESFLSTYEYRVPLPVWMFAGTGLAAFATAWLTVSYQAFRAASADPVKSLRAE